MEIYFFSKLKLYIYIQLMKDQNSSQAYIFFCETKIIVQTKLQIQF